jgi:hypothetical protein
MGASLRGGAAEVAFAITRGWVSASLRAGPPLYRRWRAGLVGMTSALVRRHLGAGWDAQPAKTPALLFQAVVLLQDLAEAVVRERDDFVVVDAFHGFGGDHGIYHRFFGGLDGGKEDGVKGIVGQHG